MEEGPVVYHAPGVRRKIAVFSDVHGSHRDRAAWAVWRAFLAAYRPDEIISLGDFTEFAAVGSYSNATYHPETGALLVVNEDDFVAEVGWARAEWARLRRDHPEAKIVHLDGNHEQRLGKYLLMHAPQIAGLKSLSLIDLWELDQQRIEWRRYGSAYWIKGGGGIKLTHGTRTTARAEMATHRCNGVSGHIHKTQSERWRMPGDQWITWQSIPALCRLDPLWMPAGAANWDQGGYIMEYDAEQDYLYREVVPIQNGRLYFRGHCWQAREGEEP